MNADRWKAIKEVFEAALAVPAAGRQAFLDQRCAGDAELRQEVESLLGAHTDAGDFLDQPAAPAGKLNAGFGNLIGQTLGPYKVLELVGEGGMGAVYLARDERLKRKVAIKTLHASLAWDPELIARLKLEAKAESAINHPNICTVFDVGDWQGVPYIVMEYLEGEPLRNRMKGQPLEVDRIASIGASVASALEAAHAKGIIHRDVKPGNIFLTTDGQVKIMDFGVAKKIVLDEFKPGESALTQPWIRVGTVTHMSPEQARGEKIDGRSDLFSLGSVLYEMATGKAPFRGEGPHAVMEAIMSANPAAPSALNPATPRDLERIVCKALEKDPALRYQTGGDLAADLKRLQRDASSGKIAAVKPAAPRVNRWVWAGTAAVLALGAGYWLRPRPRPLIVPAKVVSLASLRGLREDPAISVDGDRVAFSWTGEGGDVGEKEIYVQFLGAGQPLKLTDGPGRAEAPVWSPDGREIAYLRTGGGKTGYYRVSSLGGAERLLTAVLDPPPRAGGSVLDWSPDRKSMILADRESESGKRALLKLDLSTGERRSLGVTASYVSNPVYSPDGSEVAFTMGPSFLSHDIYVMPSSGGSPRRLTHDGRWMAGLTWTEDGAGLVFSSRKVGPFSLWSVPAAGGVVTPVAQSGTDARSPNIGRKSKRLVYARTKLTRNLWRMNPRDPAGAKEIISSTRTSFQPEYSPDGSSIVFASDRTGSFEIWVAGSDGSQPQQLTNFAGAQTGSPRWSPDGQWIAFDSRPDGHSDIHTIRAATGQQRPRRLTDHAADDRTPVWSADGKLIYFISNRSGRNEIWSIAAEGGEARQITGDNATYAIQDPETKAIFYTNGQGLWRRTDSGAGKPERIAANFPLLSWRLHRGRLVWGRPDAARLHEIVSMGLDGGEPVPLVKLAQRTTDFDTFAFSSDGALLLYDRVDQVENELLLMDLQ